MSTWAESVIVMTYVVCDECGSGCQSDTETKEDAIRRAKEYGWKRIAGRVFCPECQQTTEGKQP